MAILVQVFDIEAKSGTKYHMELASKQLVGGEVAVCAVVVGLFVGMGVGFLVGSSVGLLVGLVVGSMGLQKSSYAQYPLAPNLFSQHSCMVL
eukprot:CAMPEP_0201876444 /NCGR_PEP_ID=MMETSP0902-20130614/8136_1 /ASSEMBLY_ACC=CAM_ASM_000551 /TAXON_ID=420261 /ORGANISM="Thalassiosira antarctica, Strain CCMP982" /LENGTH=91 /DNA_ID=CAMNT_0048403695 /DNA_START=661 /DNA_END=936 /DNA_ORIENTATION=+